LELPFLTLADSVDAEAAFKPLQRLRNLKELRLSNQQYRWSDDGSFGLPTKEHLLPLLNAVPTVRSLSVVLQRHVKDNLKFLAQHLPSNINKLTVTFCQ